MGVDDMCWWCAEYEFTINRADEYTVRKRPDGRWYSASPNVVLGLIEAAIKRGDVYIYRTLNELEGFDSVDFVDKDKRE